MFLSVICIAFSGLGDLVLFLNVTMSISQLTTTWSFQSPKVREGSIHLFPLILPSLDITQNIADIWIMSSKDQRIDILSSQEGNEIEADISRVQEEGGG